MAMLVQRRREQPCSLLQEVTFQPHRVGRFQSSLLLVVVVEACSFVSRLQLRPMGPGLPLLPAVHSYAGQARACRELSMIHTTALFHPQQDGQRCF
jgi:hypothetical protein